MTHTTPTLSPDWGYTSDYSEAVLELGGYRARVVHDTWPTEPECECQDPVVDDDTRTVVYGGMWPGHEAGTDFAKANRLMDEIIDGYYRLVSEFGPDVADRWLRIFHDGKTSTISGDGRGGSTYTVFGVPAHRALMGVPDEHLHDDPTAVEWEAFVDNEMYGIVIEEREIAWRRATGQEFNAWINGELEETEDFLIVDSKHGLIVSDDVEWEEVDSCWGYAGEAYAKEQAQSDLSYYAARAAA